MRRFCAARQVLLSRFLKPGLDQTSRHLPCSRTFARSVTTDAAEEELAKARQWYAQLSASPLPRDIGDVSYSRSSGPGGQNVNKVNSKAQLRVPLDQLLPLVPSILHSGVRASRYHAEKTNSLLIQADDSRKQNANKDTCYRKLTEMLVELYKATVPGETSREQKYKVKKLQKAENEGRLKTKKMQSSKKASRSRRSDD